MEEEEWDCFWWQRVKSIQTLSYVWEMMCVYVVKGMFHAMLKLEGFVFFLIRAF
jgi:hypothetical protein